MEIDYRPGRPNLLTLTKRLGNQPTRAETTEGKT
jgi:hypothetical protein